MKFNLKNAEKPWVDGLDVYVPGLMIPGYVKLASNENNYGPSPKVREAICSGLDRLKTYPYLGDKVIESIAQYAGCGKENIMLGNGSDELIESVFRAFKGPAAGANPSYGEYRLFSQVLGTEFITSDLNQDFSFNANRFIAETKRANILMLCTPNNPTGTTIVKEDIKKVLDEGKLTVIDEAYMEFCGKTSIELVKKYPNLIILRTFSKAFALAGLRIGYAVSNPEIIEVMSKVRPRLSVNSVALDAALGALSDVEYMKKTVEKIIADRENLYNVINKKFPAVKSESNFILFDASPKKSQEVCDAFLKEKIILRDFGKIKGFRGEYLRVSVGTKEENNKFLQVLDRL